MRFNPALQGPLMRALCPHFEKLSLRLPAGPLHQVSVEAVYPGPTNMALAIRFHVAPLGHTFAKHGPLSHRCSSLSWWLDSKVLQGSGTLRTFVREASPRLLRKGSVAWGFLGTLSSPCSLLGLCHLALCYSSPLSIFISSLASNSLEFA